MPECTHPLTSPRRVDLVVTEMAVIKPEEDGLHLLERAPNVPIAAIEAATTAKLIYSGDVPEMRLPQLDNV